MRHQDDGDTLGVQALEHPKNFVSDARIKVAGGLVGEQQGGTVDQGAGDGDALLLAAGHL